MPFALTFDDGPGPSMPSLMRVLGDASVQATFFVLGHNLEAPAWDRSVTSVEARAMVVRAIAEGHEIGNHSRTHARDFSASSTFMIELTAMDALIRELRIEAGADPDARTLIRLPYGEQVNDARATALRAMGREPTHWTRICRDWQPRDPVELAWKMIGHVAELDREGETAVLALHASGESIAVGFERPWTVAAVKLFLAEAARRGWRSVRCPESCTPAMERSRHPGQHTDPAAPS